MCILIDGTARESCAAGSSALADYHNAGTVKYQTMIKHTEELKIAISDNLGTLSGCFFANRLITDENRQEVTNVHNSSVDRAARLVDIIQRKVQLNHQNYDTFIDVLKQAGSDYYNDILSKLSETLRDYGNSFVPLSTIQISIANQILLIIIL